MHGSPQAARVGATLVAGVPSSLGHVDPGVLAVRALAVRFAGRADVRCVDAAAAATLLDDVAGSACDVIVIGEAKLGAAPGLVTLLSGAAADRLLASHEYREQAFELCAALERRRRVRAMPLQRAVLNIEPPPPASHYAPRFVAAAVARAAAEAVALIEAWRLLARLRRARGR